MRRSVDDHGDPAPSGLHMPRRLGVVSGFIGTILGLATNLYSSAFRHAIAISGNRLTSVIISVIIATAAASAATALIYRWLVRRTQLHAQIISRELPIGSDALTYVVDEQDSVVGRSLHFLEAKRDSPELVIFLHGLGLDSDDFRPYMAESKFHCLALTQYGFNVKEKDDDHYRPISLQTHVQLLCYAIKKIQKSYPRKRISLVGFSFGADMIFFLPHFSAEAARSLNIRTAVLLDPNVNHSTTTISARIAVVDRDRPLDKLVKILESADDVAEFRNLCEYLYKITSKNFAQIQRHAKDVIDLWPGELYEKFLDRFGQLTSISEEIRVVLSFDYERHYNLIARGAVTRGLDPKKIECSRSGHFDLIGPRFLKDLLEGVL